MEAALAVVGWFAAPAIQVLLEKFSSDAFKQRLLKTGLKDDLKRLEDTLLKVQSVINVTSKKQIDPESLVELLRRLKSAAYDAEELLDEFEYEGLKQIVEASDDDPYLTSSSKCNRIKAATSRVSDYFCSKFNNPTMCCLTGQSGSTSTSTNSKSPTTADEIQKIVGRLESISDDVCKIVGLTNSSSMQHDETWKKRETTSALRKGDTLYGRDEVREEIINKLLDWGDESRPGSENVSVIPIVGIGGMGKTTLARHVFNDKRVVDRFSTRVWVYVSQNFDESRITRDIIQQLPGGTEQDLSHITSLQPLQQTLMQKLKGIRFMLVLDDVWTHEWTALLTPLDYGDKGSKVVVTCRQETDLDGKGMMNKIQLGDLEKDAIRSLFMEHAFRDFNHDKKYSGLHHIGKQISEKLTGSPLEAVTLGWVLNRRPFVDVWKNILENHIWGLKPDENRILEVLRWSYDRLPGHLQQCFAYCSVFPKGYEFDKDKLVQIWIALGFIMKESNKRLEDTGREYFDDLLCSSFFNHPYGEEHYVMHDLMNDLAMSVSKDECFRIEGDESYEVPPPTVRHLFLSTEHLPNLTLRQFENLRSFIFDGFGSTLLDIPIKKFKHIRVLVLSKRFTLSFMLVDSIGELIHLRYLDLSGFRFGKLPESLWKLYHLQVLKLYQNHHIIGVENLLSLRHLDHIIGVKNLLSLRHLPVNGFDLSKIAKIGRLTSLQELSFMFQKKSGHELAELKDIRDLEVLEIKNLENVRCKGEEAQANLYEKRYLAELLLHWDSEREPPNHEMDELVLEGLRPHPNLKELRIKGYEGGKFPTWMESLSNLKFLSLKDCTRWEVLPPLGQLGSLKELKIKNFEEVRQVDHTFYGSGDLKGFPSLEKLSFGYMPKWEEWSDVEDCLSFPHLHKLEILDCPELKQLPPLPLSLRKLTIKNSGLVSLPRMAESSSNNISSSSSSLYWLKVEGCQNLNSLGESLLQQNQLRALEHLTLQDCRRLTSLGGLQSLTCLKTLTISKCPKLTMNLPEEDESVLPSSLCHLLALKMLYISDCEELKTLGGLHALVSLEDLALEGCPKLTAASLEGECLFSLQRLDIGSISLLTAPQLRRSVTSIRVLIVNNCPEWTSVTVEEEECFRNLTSIQELTFYYCETLQSLPTVLQSLSSLKELEISYCPELKSLPDNGLPTSLTTLSIEGCEMLKDRCQEGGDDWDKIAHIPDIFVR